MSTSKRPEPGANKGSAAYDFARIRLFVEEGLSAGASIFLEGPQVHYLVNVMRLAPGAHILLFNGRDGEWLSEIETVKKKTVSLRPLEQSRPQVQTPDLELLFAPIKQLRLDFLVQKATELGVTRLTPVITRFTNAKLKESRMAPNVIEAAEQCGRLDLPEIAAPQKLMDLISAWPKGRRLLFCDEAADAAPIRDVLKAEGAGGAWSILIGPEGGFAPEEREALRALEGARAVSLGPRIMRADTAALAALAVFQAECGDWAPPKT